MEPVLAQLLPMLTAIWWPFCRILAMFIGAPVLGEAVTPVTVRILIALVLAVLMAMGMMMLSPPVISLPFKLLLFVLVDGWTLTVNTLVTSIQAY